MSSHGPPAAPRAPPPHEHADLFMHPQSCIIEELVQEQEEVQQQQQQQQKASTADSTSAAQAAGDDDAGAAAPTTAGAPDDADTGDAASSSPATEEQQEQQCLNLADPQQRQAALEACDGLKRQGNAAYARGDYDEALQLYWQAIDTAPEDAQQRAVYYANAAACYLKQQQWQLAAEQCTAALKLDEGYIKALVRRSQALQEMDDLEHALADAQRVLQLEAGNTWAPKVVADLGPEVQRRQEKLKEEMLGKLKDLGNTLLGKIGMSLDNFKAEQDPNTGGYSIKFVQ